MIIHQKIYSAQSFPTPVGSLDKTDARICERHLKPPARVLTQRDFSNTAPAIRQSAWIRGLQFDSPISVDNVSANSTGPFAATSWFPVSLRLAFGIPIEFKKGTASVRRMELHSMKTLGFVLPCDPDIHANGARLACQLGLMGIALADYHIATITIAPFEVTAGGGAFLDRRNHFDEIAANRHQRILQAKDRHSLIDETYFEVQNIPEIIDNGSKLVSYQTDLTEMDWHSGFLRCFLLLGLRSPPFSSPERPRRKKCSPARGLRVNNKPSMSVSLVLDESVGREAGIGRAN
jgi:hypothetical protein